MCIFIFFFFSSAKPIAGSGKEENRPNLYPMRAGFAQPSGIAYSPCIPEYLFIADSESSTIKSLNIRSGAVANIVGGGLDPTVNYFYYFFLHPHVSKVIFHACY